jgi:Zn-dependent peptidase ImmA (M78 family)
VIRQELFIEKYDWHLVILYNANLNLSAVADELWNMKCPAKIAIRAIKEVITKKNNGFCFTNDLIKSTLMCIAEADSDEEFVNTIVHELKHLQSHICSYYGIDETSEEAAYLIGDTAEELYRVFKHELNI